MKQSGPAAGVPAFVRAKSELPQQLHPQAPSRTIASWRRLALLALCCIAPAAWGADLQLTDLSDSGYDPVPAGSDVVYAITLENGAGDVANNTVSIFDLPAGTTANSLPAFCTADAGVPTRIVCNHGALQGTLAGGSPVSVRLKYNACVCRESGTP